MIAMMAEVLPVPGGPCTTTQAHATVTIAITITIRITTITIIRRRIKIIGIIV